MQSSRISNYLSIQKDQISVSINSPTQMFRLIRKVTVQMTNDDQIAFFEGRRQKKLRKMIIKGRADVKKDVSTFLTSYWQEIVQSQVTFQGSSVGFIALARKCIQAVLEVDSKVRHIQLEVKYITLLSVIAAPAARCLL